jgi:acetoin utilization deacetylase AcuC-like enzyme
LGHEDLQERDRRVFAFARTHHIPLAWVLAGGYTKDIAEVVRVHTNTFAAAAEIYPS